MSDPIERLYRSVLSCKAAGSVSPRTEKLLGEGIAKMAKKLAEEAVEVGLDAVMGNRAEVIEESADLIYNLCVIWAAAGIAPAEVWREMARREKMMGIAEKLPKPPKAAKPRASADTRARPLPPAAVIPVEQRRRAR